MPVGTPPNDVFWNGRWFNRAGVPVGLASLLDVQGLPTVLLPSATAISATGAISGLATAINNVPIGSVIRAYCAAQAGLAAGMYFARFSTTTDCQLYTNAAGTTTPTGITPATYAGGTGEATLYSVPLPAGIVTENGVLRVSLMLSWASATTTNRTYRIKIGGTTVYSNDNSGAANAGSIVQVTIRNRGAFNQQLCASFNPGTVNQQVNGFGFFTTAVDMSQPQTLQVTGQLSGSAADYMVLENVAVEVLSE